MFWFFAVLGVLAAIAMIYIGLLVASLDFRPRHKRAPVTARESDEIYSVQDVINVRGTNFALISIGIGKGSNGYSSGLPGQSSDYDRRNLVLLDKATGVSRTVLPDNRRRIAGVVFYPAEAGAAPVNAIGRDLEDAVERASGEEKPKPSSAAYYIVTVRRAEENGQDRQEFLVGNFATGAQAFVFRALDGVDRLWMLTPTRLAVLLRQGGQLEYRVIDLTTLKPILARPVAIG